MKYRMPAKFMGLVLTCVALAGCASPYTYYCDDGCGGPAALSGRHGDCGSAACDGCGSFESVPGDTGCGPCGVVDPFCGHTITGLLRGMVTCNAGCGDIYWGEWSHDPPDQCDPCNNHGDFVGQRCCPPSCWSRIWSGIHGARYCPVGCTSGCSACCDIPCGREPGCGCDDCGGHESTIYEDEGYESVEPMEQLEPVPAQPPAKTASARHSRSQPYYSRDPNSRLVRRPAR